MRSEKLRALLDWPVRHVRPLILGLLILLSYVAAINRTQALPWAIAALLLATLLSGLIWPYLLVKKLSVLRSGPTRAEEGETISFRVEVTNHGLMPRFMVELVDHLPFVGTAEAKTTDSNKTLGMIAYVPSKGKCQFEVPVVCEKRGHYRLGPVGLASSFPLGLAEARGQRSEGVQTLTIYPDIFTIVGLPLHGTPSQIHRGGYQLPEGAGTAEFAGLREYRRGDNPRHVHWPTTARLNDLMIKEFEPLASACMTIILDQSQIANIGTGKHASFEYGVRIAGSMARFACDHNIPTRLIGQGKQLLNLASGIGAQHYQDILDTLAVIDADGETTYAKIVERFANECRRGETVVVFISEPAHLLPETLQALALLRARGAHLFAMIFERQSFAPDENSAADGTEHALAALLDMNAFCMKIRQNDDLVKLFNA